MKTLTILNSYGNGILVVDAEIYRQACLSLYNDAGENRFTSISFFHDFMKAKNYTITSQYKDFRLFDKIKELTDEKFYKQIETILK